jgi:hypothetical protein
MTSELVEEGMEHETSKKDPFDKMGSHKKFLRFPLALGIVSMALAHVGFFLPFRLAIPLSPEVDPWWGLGLVLLDALSLFILVRPVLKQLMQKMILRREG